jgi:Domain of unknown function (DUF4129)
MRRWTGRSTTGRWEAGVRLHSLRQPSAPFLIFLSFIFLSFLPPLARAQELSETDQAVEQVGDALNESGHYPWYDSKTDGVRPIPLANSSDADSANRDSKWTAQPKASTPGRMPQLSFLGWLLNWVGITLLVVFLALIAWLITKAFLKDEISEGIARKVIETSRDVDRVEALPFKLRKPTGDFLAEARRLYEAGDYSEAIIYFFSFQLVELDRHHLIRLAKGKTNRQYLREVRPRPNLHAILGITIVAFEDAFFGRKTLSREQFERCWTRLDEFQGELARLERAAA